jgi:hypothetical protein
MTGNSRMKGWQHDNNCRKFEKRCGKLKSGKRGKLEKKGGKLDLLREGE